MGALCRVNKPILGQNLEVVLVHLGFAFCGALHLVRAMQKQQLSCKMAFCTSRACSILQAQDVVSCCARRQAWAPFSCAVVSGVSRQRKCELGEGVDCLLVAIVLGV